ncbi:MAG: M28 family peptidase, partial [Actinomycetia bacterium]|nr:M28 family peptidase [Actinomycetes bacterium]
ARRKAEMKNEQRTHRDGEPEIVRSRFADVPTNSNAAPSAPTQLTTSDLSPIFEPVEPALAAADLPAEVDLSAAFELPPTGEQLALDGPVAAVSDAAVVTRPAGNRRSAALPDPDFSGLDRQAFRVVADQHQTAPLIIPLRGDSAGDSENTPALPVPTSISPMVPPTLASAAPAAAVPAAGVSTPVVPVAPAVPTAGSVATSFAAPTSASASPPTYAPPAASAPASQPIYAPSAPTYAPSAPTPAAPPTASAPASPPTSVPQAPSTPAPDPLVQVTNTTVSVAKTTVTLRHSDLSQRLAALPEVTPSLDSKTAGQQIALQSEPDIPTDQLFASADSLVSNTGAFIPLASTGVMKPVGEDLLAYHEDSGADLFVADADDSIQTSASHYTAGGTYSDPELMQIKETGLRSLLGRLGHGRREKRDLDDSPAEWLGVEEGYDARQAGESIGSWQNFSEDDDDQEPWQGGAFGGTSAENAQAMAELSQELLDKEVWLVALGSGDLGHSGVRNLLKRHDRQLKGSLYINVLGVGAGDLCFTILEGEIISTRTDQRLQNLLAAAAQELAVPLAPRVFTAFDTDASVVLHQTGRAISLIGMGDALPKYWRNKDDAVGQIREDKITATSDLILETIKNC